MTDATFIESLLAIATSDLQASTLLYNQRQYLQSTFYLQQSIEKANKALVLYCDFLKPPDVRHVGHDYTRIHNRIVISQLQQWEQFDKEDEAVTLFMDALSKATHFDYGAYRKSLETTLQTIPILQKAEFSEEELLEIIDQIEDEYKTELLQKEDLRHSLTQKANEIVASVCAELQKNYREVSKHLFEELYNKNETLKFIVELTRNMLEAQQNLYKATITLSILGFVTSPLVSKVRYPYLETNHIPETLFTQQHPYIKYQPKLLELTSFAMRDLRYYIT